MTHPEFEGSQAFQLVQSQGWNWKQGTAPNITIEICPYCNKDNHHFYMEIHGKDDEQKSRDGLALCMKCGKGGNLYSLKKHLGLVIEGVESRKDYAGGERKIDPLPDLETCHEVLLADIGAMDYLVNGRGFSREIIQRQKIGLVEKKWFKQAGEVKALVYPYLVNGNSVFAHFRTLPTMPLSENRVPKDFASPKGWDATLYNGEILREGLTEVFMVEGEPNCIAAMDKGIDNIVGVPGANFKKSTWIESIDKLNLEKIYICYDKDRVGQRAAQVLATKIGIEKCWKIKLPDFLVTTDEGETRPGKDLNEYFTHGGTAESFEALKAEAVLFDVEGVASSKDAIQEFLDELDGKEGLTPTYKSQWPSLNKLVGFEPGDVIDWIGEAKQGKTTTVMNFAEHMASTYGEGVLFCCLEMTRARVARKWISHKAQIADNMPDTPEEARQLLLNFREAVPRIQEEVANREGDFYFCYPSYKTVEDIYTLFRDCIRRYGVKWIVIDNIQRLADTTPKAAGHNRTEHLSAISKALSQIAKDYDVQMVRILQPNRNGEVDGSSQIDKDCDCKISVYRTTTNNRDISKQNFDQGLTIESKESFSPEMLLTVGLSRYSSGGQAKLWFDGAKSTISELSAHQLAEIIAMSNRNIGHGAALANMGIVPANSLNPETGQPFERISI